MKEGWEYKKLGEVCCPKKDIKRANKCFQKEDAIRYIDISSVDNTSSTIASYSDYIFQDAPSRAQQVVENGDIVLSLVRPNLKNIAIVKDSYENMVASSGFCVLRVNGIIDNRYLFYIVTSPTYTDYLLKNVSGANYPAVTEDIVKKWKFPLPPLSEQQSIVAELDKINEIINLKKEQLKDLDLLAQSIFYEMFGDPIENSKGWEVKKLGEVCSKISSGATPKGGNESYKDEGISLIRSLNVHNNRFEYKDLAHIDDEQANQLKNVVVCENDVLLNITGASVARCTIVPQDVLPARVNQHVMIIRIKEQFATSYFLCYQLTNRTYQDVLLQKSRSNAATREALPKKTIEGCSIILPPLSLQQSFAEKIQAIESQKSAIKQSLADMETLLASRMDYYFN